MTRRRKRHIFIPILLTTAVAGLALLVWWMLQTGRFPPRDEIPRRQAAEPRAANPHTPAAEDFTAAERQSLEDILKQHNSGAPR